MSGWKGLDKLLEQAQADITAPRVAAQDLQSRINDDVRRLFEPVFAVCDKLREANVLIPGLGSQPCLVPSGVTLRVSLQQMSSPAVYIILDRATTLAVRVAVKSTLPYPDIITTAKWRCVLTANGHELETALYDNRDLMAQWIFSQVLTFAARPANPPLPPPLPITSVDPDVTAQPARDTADQPAREHRIIMVDDPTQ